MNDFILLKQKSLYSSKTDERGYQLSKGFWLFGYILNGNYYFKTSLFTVWHKCHGLLLKFKNLSGVSLVAQKLKNLPAKQETRCQSLGLEKRMATHSSIPAWKSPLTEEPGGYSPWSHKESDTAEQLTLYFKVKIVFLPKICDGVYVRFFPHTCFRRYFNKFEDYCFWLCL